MNKNLVVLSLCAVGFASAGSANAAIVGVGGASVLIAAPTDATLNQLTSTTQVRVWDELQGIILTQNVVADAVAPGLYNMSSDLTTVTINTGTLVSSHYIHFDSPAKTPATTEGSVTFDQKILGVIVRGDGNAFLRLDDSDFLSSGTMYDDNLQARGMEFNNAGTADRFTISGDGKTLTYKFGITEPGDRVRVVTAAVPEPATMAVLAVGALALVRKRRK